MGNCVQSIGEPSNLWRAGLSVLLVVATTGAAWPTPEELLVDARIHRQMRDAKRVVDITRAMLAPRPDAQLRLEANILLGAALVELGRWSEARQAFRYVLRMRPEYRLRHRDRRATRLFESVRAEERRLGEALELVLPTHAVPSLTDADP